MNNSIEVHGVLVHKKRNGDNLEDRTIKAPNLDATTLVNSSAMIYLHPIIHRRKPLDW
jgi:hypothetical protein